MREPTVMNQSGKLVVSSRNVAEVFEKEHYHVLRDIEAILPNLSPEFGASNFGFSSYTTEQNKILPEYLLTKDGLGLSKSGYTQETVRDSLCGDNNLGKLKSEPTPASTVFFEKNFILTSYVNTQNGQSYPEYLMTKDGLMLLVMGYTGAKAMAMKIAYINRFNEMEQALKSGAFVTLKEKCDLAKMLLAEAGITGNQMVLSLDKLIKAKTGDSLLALTGTQLIAPIQGPLMTPSDLGAELGVSGKVMNLRLEKAGLQVARRTKKGELVWELTNNGREAGGVYLDTNKKHSDGTPIRQLKWPHSVIARFN